MVVRAVKRLRAGSKGRDALGSWSSFDKVAASNPRRVGLNGIVWGLVGRTPPSRWVQGERSLPREWFNRRYGLHGVEWRMNEVIGPGHAIGRRGCNGERASGFPLPRWCCMTTHILRSALFLSLFCLTNCLTCHSDGVMNRSGGSRRCLKRQSIRFFWPVLPKWKRLPGELTAFSRLGTHPYRLLFILRKEPTSSSCI